MSKKYIVRAISQDLSSTEAALQPKQVTRIKAAAAAKFQLIQADTGTAPDVVLAKRVGNDLHVDVMDDTDEPQQLVIEGYFDGTDRALVGQAENGMMYDYVPQFNDPALGVNTLAQNQSVAYVLGEMQVVSGAAVGVLAFNPLLAALGVEIGRAHV